MLQNWVFSTVAMDLTGGVYGVSIDTKPAGKPEIRSYRTLISDCLIGPGARYRKVGTNSEGGKSRIAI